jgi:hypothetical protein
MVDNRAKVYREHADDCRAQVARDQPGEKGAWLKLADDWLRLAHSLDDLGRVASENAQQSSERHLHEGGDHDSPFRGRPRASRGHV